MESAEQTTRDRLLEAAGEVFAGSGFREATVRDICARAGVNIAAVNYHFGGKDGLYRAVLEQADSHAGLDDLRASLDGLSGEHQLRLFIHEFMARMLAEGKPAWQGKLMVREMADPTEALDVVVERTVRPHWDLLVNIVARLAGPAADRTTVESCAASVIGQCVLYRNCAPILDRLLPDRRAGLSTRQLIDSIAARIADFSLGALASLRDGRRSP